MARVISQDAYDQIVNENITEFDMSPQEAIEDAVKQLEAQGVDLTNIIKDLAISSNPESHLIKSCVAKIGNLIKTSSDDQSELLSELAVFRTECNKDLPHRVLAEKEGGYFIILDVLEKNKDNTDVTKEALKAMISLMTGQPDPLETKGINYMLKTLNENNDIDIQRLVLKWMRECCIKHEMNRQEIFDANILDHLKKLLTENPSAQIIRDVCGVLRALVLDDDIRVEFGKAHDHAKAIASDTLVKIMDLLTKFKKDETLVSDLMLTLASLLVRNEFCQTVEDAGGLKFILDVLVEFNESEKLNRQGLKLLKALSGNDSCKASIINYGGAPIIMSALTKHKSSLQFAIMGLSCVATLSLRSIDNSNAMFAVGIHEATIECMQAHPDNLNVQKQGSWAIRNMVSRSRDKNKLYLNLGAEEILRTNMKKFGTQCEYDCKSALRDLGCDVDLKEEWTGIGGKITTSAMSVAMKE